MQTSLMNDFIALMKQILVFALTSGLGEKILTFLKGNL